jgi:thiamine pyrophosphate-dependent acetolactate synthase large subunit-like protein
MPAPSRPEIDFCGLAASQGCKAVRVQSATALDDALRCALAASEPTLAEVIVES